MALCRTHHRLYDAARLNLLAYLGGGFEAELEHAQAHVGFAAMAAGLSGGGWPRPE